MLVEDRRADHHPAHHRPRLVQLAIHHDISIWAEDMAAVADLPVQLKHLTKSILNLTVSFRLSVWLFYRGQCLDILYGLEILFEIWMFGEEATDGLLLIRILGVSLYLLAEVYWEYD